MKKWIYIMTGIVGLGVFAYGYAEKGAIPSGADPVYAKRNMVPISAGEEDFTVTVNKRTGDVVVKDSKGRKVKKVKKAVDFPIKATRIHQIDVFSIIHFEGSDCLGLTGKGETDVYCFSK